MDYTALIGIGIQLAQSLVGMLTTAKAPQEVLDAAAAAVTALQAHQDDLVTKANLEAQRS